MANSWTLGNKKTLVSQGLIASESLIVNHHTLYM